MKKIGPGGLRSVSEEGAVLRISEAAFPAPFAQVLEFNAPVHETWNIVHIGMLMPQSHQIYICSDNCMRGVVMTAAEMNALERFSCVVIEENDLLSGGLEEITLEGVTDVLHKLSAHRNGIGLPKAVLVFPVCLHHFTGCDMGYVYRELEKRFPEIVFIRCWMDPIMQKTGPTPDMKLRKAMMDILKPSSDRNGTAALIGDIYALDPECELKRLIDAADAKQGLKSVPLQVQDCATLDEYEELSKREILITRSPMAREAAEKTACRLGMSSLYLPGAVLYDEICALLAEAAGAMGITLEEAGINLAEEIKRCDEALLDAHEIIGNTCIAVDAIAVQRPVGLARLLLEHGFNVKEIYLDAVSLEEEADFAWLGENHSEVLLCSTIHVKGRVQHAAAIDQAHREYLAIGPKAAWYCGTEHFVNLVDHGGMWGLSGIRKLAALMKEAFYERKDTRDLVPRKGLGCESLII